MGLSIFSSHIAGRFSARKSSGYYYQGRDEKENSCQLLPQNFLVWVDVKYIDGATVSENL